MKRQHSNYVRVLDVLEWLCENQGPALGPARSIMFFLLNIILHPLGTLEMHKLCTFWAKVPAPFLEHLRSERETGQNFGLIVTIVAKERFITWCNMVQRKVKN